MIGAIIFLSTLGALNDCQYRYDSCVVALAEQQATYNGCELRKRFVFLRSLPYQDLVSEVGEPADVVEPLNVLDALNFTDATTCEAHTAACGYTLLHFWAAANACITE